MHHLIVFFEVYNNDISRCFFHFFETLNFWVLGECKGQQIAQNDKKKVVLLRVPPMIVVFGTHV